MGKDLAGAIILMDRRAVWQRRRVLEPPSDFTVFGITVLSILTRGNPGRCLRFGLAAPFACCTILSNNINALKSKGT